MCIVLTSTLEQIIFQYPVYLFQFDNLGTFFHIFPTIHMNMRYHSRLIVKKIFLKTSMYIFSFRIFEMLMTRHSRVYEHF